MQNNKVLQTKMKVLRKINVLFVNKNKVLEEENIFFMITPSSLIQIQNYITKQINN